MGDFNELLDVYHIMDSSLLFIGAIGFDNRCIEVLKTITDKIDSNHSRKQMFLFVYLNNPSDLHYLSATRIQKQHETTIKKIMANKNLTYEIVDTKQFFQNNHFFAHVNIMKKLKQINLNEFKNIIIDTSSMPRAIILYILDYVLNHTHDYINVFVTYAYYKTLGSFHPQIEIYEPIIIGNESEVMDKIILIPILGYNYNMLEAIIRKYHNRIIDIYPVVGLPSIKPLESDNIVKYNRKLFIEYGVPFSNVIYGSMYNPFILYMKLSKLVNNIRNIGNFDIVTAPLGTKPQAVATGILKYIDKINIVYTPPRSYPIITYDHVSKILFYWIKGEVYINEEV